MLIGIGLGNVVKLILTGSLKFAAGLLAIGFVATALVRLAPGFGTDERELDPRLVNASIEHLRARQTSANIPAAYLQLLRGAAAGDFGHSYLLDRPVRELLAERWPTTANLAIWGWLTGGLLAFAMAGGAVIMPRLGLRLAGAGLSSSLLCLPATLLAYLSAVSYTPAYCAIAAIVFARVFCVLDSLFAAAVATGYVTGARCRGVSNTHIFLRHILAAKKLELIALSATSLTLAIAASVPVEVLSDQAGMGQLAWKAAMGRDLPLLVGITVAMATVTLFLSRSADVLVSALAGRSR